MSGIDVLVPSYQYDRFLRDAVTSVLSQETQDLRVLIIDNASTDNSAEVARELATKDRRVDVVVWPSNLGVTASINAGIEWAEQEYFMMFSADDLLTPRSLARAVRFMDEHPNVGFTHGKEVEWALGEKCPDIDRGITDTQWRITSGRQFIEERCGQPANFIALGTMVVRTSVQKRAGHYRAELTCTQDLEMMLRLACLGDVGETNAVQGIRRLHGSNQSNLYFISRTADMAYRQASFESFFVNEGGAIADGERLRRCVRRNLAQRAYWLGVREFCRGAPNSGLELLTYAFKVRPITAVLPPISYLLRRAISPADPCWPPESHQ